MAGAVKRVDKIRQIVRLKQVMQRWKNMSLVSRPDRDSPTVASSNNSGSNRRVPSGFLAVYVGVDERHRFLIPTRFLNLPVFVSLLNKAEEEFGFRCNGGLVLPCDVEFFKHVLRFLERDETRCGGFGLDEFLKLISDVGFESCKDLISTTTTTTRNNNSSHGYTPLLQKTRA